MALVIVLSAFNGLTNLVGSLFENFDSDIRIEAARGKVFPANNINYTELQNTAYVEDYTKVLTEVCGASYKKEQTIVHVKGVENSFLEMSKLDSNLLDGRLLLEENGINYAIVGYGIASQLGFYLDKAAENFTIYAPKRGKVSTTNPMNAVYRKMISPSGVFYISPEYDLKYIIVPLNFVQDLLDYDNEISAIEINVTDESKIEETTKAIQTLVGPEFSVKSRFEFNEIIYKTNKTEKWATYLILVFILIIAAFNILSSLSMLIIEKKEDIKTLKSMGAKIGLIRNIFFIEGLLINLIGAVAGLTLGIAACLIQQHFGILELQGGIVPFYPVLINPIEIIYIFITVMVIGFITTWFPVRNLTKVTD